MDCKEFMLLLNDYIDGELEKEQEEVFLHHADECESCAQRLREARTVSELMGAMQFEVPLNAEAAWCRAIKQEAHKDRMQRIAKVCIPIAAALVVALGCTFFLNMPKKDAGILSETQVLSGSADSAAMPVIASDGVSAANATMGDFDIRENLSVNNLRDAQNTIESLCGEYGARYSVESGSSSVIYRITISSGYCDEFVSSLKTVGRETDALRGNPSGDTAIILVQISEG